MISLDPHSKGTEFVFVDRHSNRVRSNSVYQAFVRSTGEVRVEAICGTRVCLTIGRSTFGPAPGHPSR